jgi:hypothetical protein
LVSNSKFLYHVPLFKTAKRPNGQTANFLTFNRRNPEPLGTRKSASFGLLLLITAMFTAISFPQNLAAQSPCNSFEVSVFPFPATPCPETLKIGDLDTVKTVFLLHPVGALYTYCDKGTVDGFPDMRVLEFTEFYLNKCAKENLPNGCYYTGDLYATPFVDTIRNRHSASTPFTYKIEYNKPGGQSDHEFDQNYKDFVFSAHFWRPTATLGSCPVNHFANWLIDNFELQENPITHKVEIRVTYKKVCCSTEPIDDGGPSTP